MRDLPTTRDDLELAVDALGVAIDMAEQAGARHTERLREVLRHLRQRQAERLK